MKIELRRENNVDVAVVRDTTPVLTDVSSALDLLATVKYETGSSRIVMGKEAVNEDFFRLSTRLAGEILQKFINYHVKFAVYGDFTGYTSKPLRDFIYESNQGRDVFFVATEAEAVERLSQA